MGRFCIMVLASLPWLVKQDRYCELAVPNVIKGSFHPCNKNGKKLNIFSYLLWHHTESFGFISQVLRIILSDSCRHLSANSVLRWQLITQNMEIKIAKLSEENGTVHFYASLHLYQFFVRWYILFHISLLFCCTHTFALCASECMCVFCVCLLKWDLYAILLCLLCKTSSEYVCTQLNTCKQCFFFVFF